MAQIVRSKLTIPQLPGTTLVSDRIRRLGIGATRVTELVAPAGYGKTTATIAVLGHRANVHWYRLDAEDVSLPIFYAHLLACLFEGVRSRHQPEARSYLQSIPNLDDGYVMINAAICQDMWTLYGTRRKGKRYLVLDDFQNVLTSAPIRQTVRYFAANLPPCFRIVLSSRRPNGLFDDSLGLKADVHQVVGDELAFTVDEVRSYLRDLRRIPITAAGASRLHRQTEGWISGIVLAGNLLGRTSELELERNEAQALAAVGVADYFLNEVVSTLDSEIARKMAVIATMEDFTPADVTEAFGLPDASQVIAYCLEHSLFIQEIPSAETTYRFHSLFRDALLSLRKRVFEPPEITQLERQAAEYYSRRDDAFRVVRHMLSAGDIGDAVRYLSQNGMRMLYAGLSEHLRLLIEDLPRRAVDSNPYLCFYQGFLMMGSDFARSLQYLTSAIEHFDRQGDADMQAQVMAVLFTAYVQRNDIPQVRTLVSRLEDLAAKVKSDKVRGVLLACKLGRAAFDEDFDDGLAIWDEVKELELDDVWLHGVNNFLAMIHYRRGDLASAQDFIERNQRMPIVKSNDQWRILNLVICHTIALYQNNKPWSEQIRAELLSLGQRYDSGYALGFGTKDAAIDRYQSNDIAAAIELMESSARHFHRIHNQSQVHRSTMYRNLWLLEQNPSAVRLDEVMQACNYLVSQPAGQGFAETAQSFAGVILRELSSTELALELLSQSYATSDTKGALQSKAGTAMHLAKLHRDIGNQELARSYLTVFADISANRGFVTYYDLFFPTLIEMAAECVVAGIRAEYAVALVHRYYGDEAALHFRKNARRLRAPSESRSFITKFGRASVAVPNIHVTMLGDFRIRVGAVEIAEKEWRTRKAQRMLRYLLLHRNRYVSKEHLAGLFWPDTERRAAAASTNVALSEIRRVLSAHGIAPEDELPLFRHRLDGFEVRTSERLTIDIDQLEALNGQLKQQDAAGRDVRQLLRDMVDLYAGDLLPQDTFEDWTDLERQHLRRIFITAARRLAHMHTCEGDYPEAEALLVMALKVEPHDPEIGAQLAEVHRQARYTVVAESLEGSLRQ